MVGGRLIKTSFLCAQHLERVGKKKGPRGGFPGEGGKEEKKKRRVGEKVFCLRYKSFLEEGGNEKIELGGGKREKKKEAGRSASIVCFLRNHSPLLDLLKKEGGGGKKDKGESWSGGEGGKRERGEEQRPYP